jgi:division protein CdvB (Snf7/Vps24/ESCRT-III family)
MKITGLACAVASLLIGCAPFQKMISSKIESQDRQIQELTMELHKSQQAYLALIKENRKLKADILRLTEAGRRLEKDYQKLLNTNSRLKSDNRELSMKINMLKILDHRVEEKRKNFTDE